jgi:kynurenine formamidase
MDQRQTPPPSARRLVDLSHEIEAGMITYKGLPAPIICDYLSRERSRTLYEPGTEFQIGKIEMVANTGTYLDCPFHRYADGKDLAQITLEQFTDLEAIVIQADYRQGLAVDVDALREKELRGRAVLVHTGWAQHWRTDQYFEQHPFLTANAAAYLAASGVKLVGIDSHNIDDTRTRSRPVHSTLLGEDILIVEHLCNLEQLPNDGFTFSAIPPRFKGMGTFPVRALARLG